MDFAHLRSMAEEAAARGWRAYADYCRLRSEGLRKPALAALEAFIAEARTWPVEARRAFTLWVAGHRMRYVGQPEAALPDPLLVQLVRPTLEAWSEAEADDPEPQLWLSRLLHRSSTWHAQPEPFLREALRRRPDYQPARLDLAEVLTGYVDFSQHHLPQDYIGDADRDLEVLEEAERLLEGLDDDRARGLRETIAHQRTAARGWMLKG